MFGQAGRSTAARLWRGSAPSVSCETLLARFLGPTAPHSALLALRANAPVPTCRRTRAADAELVHYVEAQLAGAIGAASARVVVASVVEEEPLASTR